MDRVCEECVCVRARGHERVKSVCVHLLCYHPCGIGRLLLCRRAICESCMMSRGVGNTNKVTCELVSVGVKVIVDTAHKSTRHHIAQVREGGIRNSYSNRTHIKSSINLAPSQWDGVAQIEVRSGLLKGRPRQRRFRRGVRVIRGQGCWGAASA